MNTNTSTKKRFRIYKKLLMPENDTLSTVKQLVMEKGTNIFNPDGKRYQTRLQNCSIKRALIEALGSRTKELEGRTAGSFYILFSAKGCEQQQWHYDFDPKLLENQAIKPCGVIWAIQNETKLSILSEGGDVTLQKGDCLIFDGDCVHAGSRYDKRQNTRVHCYLEVPGLQRTANTTWFWNKPSTVLSDQTNSSAHAQSSTIAEQSSPEARLKRNEQIV
jgi:hypothetical protein